MTSYGFEKAAKNAVKKILKKEHGIRDIHINDLNFVWFSYTLGFMKATIYSPKMGKKYAEVTYNRDNGEMYVDIYEKLTNTVVPYEDLDFDAEPALEEA